MTYTVITAIAAAVGSAGAFFAWRNSPLRQRRQAEREVAAARTEFDLKKAEINRAVYTRDDAKLNAIVTQLLEP